MSEGLSDSIRRIRQYARLSLFQAVGNCEDLRRSLFNRAVKEIRERDIGRRLAEGMKKAGVRGSLRDSTRLAVPYGMGYSLMNIAYSTIQYSIKHYTIQYRYIANNFVRTNTYKVFVLVRGSLAPICVLEYSFEYRQRIERKRRKEKSERADVSEVIEARGHSGRKSHESRASGCEQCYRALLPLSVRSFLRAFLLFLLLVRFLILQLDIGSYDFLDVRICIGV